MRVELENGKYLITDEAGSFRALRYGEPWRDLAGDNMVYLLASRVEELEAELLRIRNIVDAARNEPFWAE